MKKINFTLNDLYYGLLQCLTIIVATVLVGSLAGVSLPTVLFATGLGTIIFTVVTKGKTPIAVGTSGAWLGSAIAMSSFGIDHVVGMTILGGIFYILFALLIAKFPKVLTVFTPLILNVAVLMIALNLITTAVGLVIETPITGIVTIIGIIIVSQIKSLSKFAFPIGILLGTVVHGVLFGLTSEIQTVFTPTIVMPVFNWTTFGASLIFIGLITEALGDSKLVSDTVGSEFEPHKVIAGNGLASIVSGLFGCMSLTTYSESCAMVRATKFASWQSIIVCGVLFMVMSFIPQVAYVINLVPSVALAGVLLYLFTFVTVDKINSIKINSEQDQIVVIVGFIGFYLSPYLIPNISQIATGMILMVTTYLLLKLNKVKC